jgi:hypothetical protein
MAIDPAQAAETWLEHGLSTAPAARAEAEAAVAEAYRSAGFSKPATVVWLDSPYAGALGVAMLRSGSGAGPVADALITQGVTPGDTALGRSLRSALRGQPWADARARAVARLGPSGFAELWAAAGARPWRQLVTQLVSPLTRRLDTEFTGTGQIGAAARLALLDAVYGQHESAWLAAFADDPGLAALGAVARTAGWWWAYENAAVITERPVAVHRDNLGRLHHGDGPALVYPDGYGLYAWRGMPIPPEVVTELASLTVSRIQGEANAEVRRVMLEYFGYDRYLAEAGAVEIHSDQFGRLWRMSFPNDEPLVMVEVVNATPEPDGSRRTYFLRVPPTITTARAAVAWTFNLDEPDYTPLAET